MTAELILALLIAALVALIAWLFWATRRQP
jgi:uncharacterized membrane protein YqjE